MINLDEILEKFLEIAENEVGVHEIKGKESNKKIIEYHATTDLKATSDEVPWCSAFVNWVVDKTGLKGTNSASARSWLYWGKSIDEPIPGCIVVLKRGQNEKKGHVGFFYSKTEHTINVLGGNQKDSVCHSFFLTMDVLDYRIPG